MISVVSPGAVEPAAPAAYAAELSEVDGVTAVTTDTATYVDGAATPRDPTAGVLSADGFERLVVHTDVPAGSDEAADLVSTLRDVPNPRRVPDRRARMPRWPTRWRRSAARCRWRWGSS